MKITPRADARITYWVGADLVFARCLSFYLALYLN